MTEHALKPLRDGAEEILGTNASTDYYERAGAKGWSVQDTDGKPHFTYYIKDGEASFVWDGSLHYTVDVRFGGYGKPVYQTFDIREYEKPFDLLETPLGHLLAFQRACNNWYNHHVHQEA